MALIVSVLIMIVGDGTYYDSKGVFTIENLTGIIDRQTGDAGLWVFGIGFIAAALSSMLPVPLAAILTAETVFSISADSDQTETNLRYNTNKEKIDETEVVVITQRTNSMYPGRPFPKKYSNILIFIMVAVAVIVIAADSPTVEVILIAQVSFYDTQKLSVFPE